MNRLSAIYILEALQGSRAIDVTTYHGLYLALQRPGADCEGLLRPHIQSISNPDLAAKVQLLSGRESV